MLLKISLVLLALVVGLVIFIALRPDDFRVAREASIQAPPSTVFAEVNDFRRWDAWSPWAKLDPDSKVFFEGPAEGKGAKFTWTGNKDVGEGSNTITQSIPGERVDIRLDFIRPFRATNTCEFKFVPENGGTRVTWSMAGKNNFMSKLIGLFMDCEKMVGDQFDQGLTSMKQVVETKNQPLNKHE